MMSRTPFDLKRSLERIAREVCVLKVDFARLCARSPQFNDSPDSRAVASHIDDAEKSWARKDIEGAWASVHAAHRGTLPGLTKEELIARIIPIEEESAKLPEWRRDAVRALLQRADVHSVQLAMRLRDENSANVYHKVWLTRDQLEFLVWASALGLLLASAIGVFSIFYPSETPATWGITMLLTEIGIGICGGCFSVATSTFSNMNAASIPERVANVWSTSIRAILGGVSGLAGYAFAQAELFKIAKIPTDSIAFSISVAFIFGYAGEHLIARIVASSEDASKTKDHK